MDNKEIVAGLIEVVWRQGNLDALTDFWAEDCVNHADPQPDGNGLARLREYHSGFQRAFDGLSDMTIEIVRQVAEGDYVVTHVVANATQRGSGKLISLPAIRIDRMANGKIAEHWSVAGGATGEPRPSP